MAGGILPPAIARLQRTPAETADPGRDQGP